jgi:hypothetical protein
MAWDLLVDRGDLTHTQLRSVSELVPAQGEAVLRVDRVGVTANNVTYARLGDDLRYWEFFPGVGGAGRVPVWGFADVVASRVEGLSEGARVYGLLPTSSHLLVAPDRVGSHGFRDAAAHRAVLPPAYNAYVDTRTDAAYDAQHEDLQVLFRPLFMLSFTLADQLIDQQLYGAELVVVSSASSKAAYATAALLQAGGVAVVGLTSTGNTAFVQSLGCYDEVLSYEEVTRLAHRPTAYADLAGSSTLRARLHEHLGPDLVHDAAVGMTHQDQDSGPTPGPTLFFAPDVIRARTAQWGRAAFEERFTTAWRSFLPRAEQSVDVVPGHGPQALAVVWNQAVAGRTPPRTGPVLTF